mmetsp:Transcript_66932/g.145454  ORF Transcript_66932/g.145454 Transcript_66932/m.145454 type:complete len:422 (-) Transcript_66932:815-2080(-)
MHGTHLGSQIPGMPERHHNSQGGLLLQIQNESPEVFAVLGDLAGLLLAQDEEALAHPEEQEGEGKAQDNWHSLDSVEGGCGVFIVGRDDQGDGGDALSGSPEDLLDHRGLLVSVGSQDVDNVRGGIGRGDEVQDDADQDDHSHEGSVVLISVEADVLENDILGGQVVQSGDALVAGLPVSSTSILKRHSESNLVRVRKPPIGVVGVGHVQAGSLCDSGDSDLSRTEDSGEGERPDTGQDQGRDDERTHATALGDPSQECADEGTPRDPPAPVEDGPAVHPTLQSTTAVRGTTLAFVRMAKLLPGISVEGDSGEIPNVVAESGCQGIEDVPGLVQEEHSQEDENREEEGNERQNRDTLLEASHDTADGKSSDDNNNPDLGLLVDHHAGSSVTRQLGWGVAAPLVLSSKGSVVQSHERLVDLH